MRLTGKAKELFEAWCGKQTPRIITWSARGSSYETLGLYDQPESMQWGVIQDWADSIGYDVSVFKSLDSEFSGYVYISSINDDCVRDDDKTRQEARKAAIEKLNQLINEK